jgi:hypothetical protein
MRKRCFIVAASTFIVLHTAASPVPAQQRTAPAYSLEDVLVLLQGGHSAQRILNRVRQDCISFRVDASVGELRAAGADQALLDGLRSICFRGAPARPQRQTTAVDSGYIHIVGPLPSGWKRIVNQIPPNENRRISMTPGWRNTVIITAPGWCPEVVEFTVLEGEHRNWTPVLRARPWVGGCDAGAEGGS